MGYHVRVHPPAQSLLTYIHREELLRPGDRLGVAVSGGIDSVALLCLLLELRAELGVVLSVVHFNHKLRAAESDADQEFVAGLAREFKLEFFVESGDVAGYAAEEHRGLEAAARELRYGFFQRLMSGEHASGDRQGLKPGSSWVESDGAAEAAPLQSDFPETRLDKIATGHTLDDQAETVLMRVIRGTGMRGLGAIHPRVVVETEDGEAQGEIIRPLLGIRRAELEKYLREINQPWREDASNADAKFTRNRVRKILLPLLEREFNPAIVDGLAELAEIARDEEDYWENEVSGWLGTVVQWSEPAWTRAVQDISFVQIEGVDGGPGECVPMDFGLRSRIADAPWPVMNASISRPWLLTEPKAVQRRVLKAVGEQAGIPLEFKHVEEILRFSSEDGPAGKELSLPLGWKLLREPEAIVFLTPDLRRPEPVLDYEYSLPIPGRLFVPELGAVIEALRVAPDADWAEYNPQQLLRADLLPEQLTLRNWRAGDRFWPAQTKAAKKVKELLQELHVGQPERKLWPVMLIGEEIIWLRGFPVPAKYRAAPGVAALLIRQIELENI
jgi:tRNA(Ile)-lysidine synthase